MSVPEIERLRAEWTTADMHEPNARVVDHSDAEHAILTALARQRREIVDALRGACRSPLSAGLLDAADFIESRFGGREAPDA